MKDRKGILGFIVGIISEFWWEDDARSWQGGKKSEFAQFAALERYGRWASTLGPRIFSPDGQHQNLHTRNDPWLELNIKIFVMISNHWFSLYIFRLVRILETF